MAGPRRTPSALRVPPAAGPRTDAPRTADASRTDASRTADAQGTAAGPVVLVTGTSSGIGRQAVLDLLAAGCTVVAGARRKADLKDLEAAGAQGVVLDVAREDHRVRAVEAVLAEHGRIDALVNNAGYGISLPVEETPVEAMRAMFEVNLFGLHRLTQLVLPGMRARRSGRVVNVSSIAGHLPIPMIGAYSASKFAVRALSQALRAEVRPFGVHVSLVEPGRIDTRFSDRARAERRAALPEPEHSPYHAIHDRWHRAEAGGAHPRVIGRRVVHACTARRPRFRYVAPWDARSANLALRVLPDFAVNAMLSAYFRFRP